MSDAAQYPVTFAYGATDGQFYYTPTPSHPKSANWVGNYHRGDDRAMPAGTPVIVNGVQIGLSGNTGASSGAHLHIGRFVNGSDTNPQSQGFNLKAPVKVTTVSSDGINGNYVRLTDADGVQWVYLHLTKQTVDQGQLLAGGNSVSAKNLTRDEIDQFYQSATFTVGTPAPKDHLDAWEGRDAGEYGRYLLHDPSIVALRNAYIHKHVSREEVIVEHRGFFGTDPPQSTLDYWTGKPLADLLQAFEKAKALQK